MTQRATPTLVLIHGAASTHRAWDFVRDGLVSFSVEAVDLPAT